MANIPLKDFVPEYNLSNVFFAHGNVFDMNTLNPFSHVYMFDKGFPLLNAVPVIVF